MIESILAHLFVSVYLALVALHAFPLKENTHGNE